ncbi:MAG: NHL repeat-containing protein [Desulfuromonas sp.]|nr:NHL repeat-containing protein [Desulfuromonas sp.]
MSATTSMARPNMDTVRLHAILDKDPYEQKLSYPTTLFFDQQTEDAYVVDAGNSQLIIFNREGFPLDQVGRGRGLHNISSVLLHNAQLYVSCGSNSDYPSGCIHILDNAFFPTQDLLLAKPDNKNETLTVKQVLLGLNGAFYLLSTSGVGVNVFDKDWQYKRQIVPRQERLGIVDPASIDAMARDSDGNLYFLSEEMGRVFVYDYQENFMYSFGEKGGDTGKLARPRSIAVDSHNKRIYIADYLRHTVLVFSTEGQWLYEIGSKGSAPSYFYYPSGVCCDDRGTLYVADTFNHRVQIFTIAPTSADQN